MKHLAILRGVVPRDTYAPLFNEVFPSLVHPDRRTIVDTFDGGAGGAITGRVIQGTALAWAGSNILVMPGGYVVGNNSATSFLPSRAVFDTGEDAADGEWGCTVEHVAGGSGESLGVIFRDSAESAGTGFIARISTQSQLVALSRRNGATYTTVATAPLPTNPGDVHSLRAVADGENIDVYVDGEHRISHVTAELGEGNTQVGIFCMARYSRVLEFMGGTI